LDQAKAQGQTPSLSAPDGTFAAGVHRVTELIPILMNDIVATAPEDQKVRREHRTWHRVDSDGQQPNTPLPGNMWSREPSRAQTPWDDGAHWGPTPKMPSRQPEGVWAAGPGTRPGGRGSPSCSWFCARVLCTFQPSLTMDEHSQGWLLVGEDQEAGRYLGEGPDLPAVHGQRLQGQAECSETHE